MDNSRRGLVKKLCTTYGCQGAKYLKLLASLQYFCVFSKDFAKFGKYMVNYVIFLFLVFFL